MTHAVFQTIVIPAGVKTADEVEALPGDQRGDCLRAAVASLMELPLEAVPHFVSLPSEQWWDAIEAFFRDRGLLIVWQPLGGNVGGWLPLGIDMMVTGKSPRGDWNHVVIMRDWTLVHDPHPSGDGLAGDPNGAYYLFPLDPAKWAHTDIPLSVANGVHNDREQP